MQCPNHQSAIDIRPVILETVKDAVAQCAHLPDNGTCEIDTNAICSDVHKGGMRTNA